MNVNYIIGVDPGPMVGIVGLLVDGGELVGPPDVVQCSDHVVLSVLGALYGRAGSGLPSRTYLAVEHYVVGPRAAGLNAPMASERTRVAITLLKEWAASRATVVERRAIDVKPWATDARLDAAGLTEATKGMRHARDAGRHALYTAVKECGLPDPFSSRSAR